MGEKEKANCISSKSNYYELSGNYSGNPRELGIVTVTVMYLFLKKNIEKNNQNIHSKDEIHIKWQDQKLIMIYIVIIIIMIILINIKNIPPKRCNN